MIGHRLLGNTLLLIGRYRGRTSTSRSALWRFTILPSIVRWRRDLARMSGVATLTFRSLALWLLGYPQLPCGHRPCAQRCARDRSHAATLMFALSCTAFTHICCGNYAAATAHLEECIALAGEKSAVLGRCSRNGSAGLRIGPTGKASDAVQAINAGITGTRSTGATYGVPAVFVIFG